MKSSSYEKYYYRTQEYNIQKDIPKDIQAESVLLYINREKERDE